MPPVEAMGYGRPVLTTRKTSMPEKMWRHSMWQSLKAIRNRCKLPERIISDKGEKMSALKISIVIPTLNRTAELEKLLKSIRYSAYKNVEVIIVDQNKDSRLDNMIAKYSGFMYIAHYKVNFKGASRARNYGAQFVTGEIINFADDDSVIAVDTLAFISKVFRVQKYSAVFGRIADLNSDEEILHFKKKNCRINKINVYQTCIECNMFIRREVFLKIKGFDEKLGVGEYFGAEEGADLFFRLLRAKYSLFYFNRKFFYHPNKKTYSNFERAEGYGRGYGGFAKKHLVEYYDVLPFLYLNYFNLKAVISIVVFSIAGEKERVKYNKIVFKARWKGFYEWGRI